MSSGDPFVGEARGFAGLSSLVSQIPDQPYAKEQEGSTGSTVSGHGANAAKAGPAASPEPRAASKTPTAADFNPSMIVGALLIAAIVGFAIWTEYGSKNAPSPQVVPRSSPPQTPSQPLRPNSPQIVPQPRAEVTEERPPIGTDLVLSRPQLRYCLAEDIRLDEMRRLIDNTSNRQLNGFNSAVDDFNLRCSRFKYNKNTMETARTEVEARRLSLLSEARQRVTAWR